MIKTEIMARRRAYANNMSKQKFAGYNFEASVLLNHNVEKGRWHRTIFIDYGSFIGAVVGFVGSIGAASWAWYGVQKQITYQIHANTISELVFLNSELDKNSKRLYFVQAARQALSPMMVANREFEADNTTGVFSKSLHPKIRASLSMSDMFDDELLNALRNGAGGEFGFDAVELVDTVRRERKYIQAADEKMLRKAPSWLFYSDFHYGSTNNTILNTASRAESMNAFFVRDKLQTLKQIDILKKRVGVLLGQLSNP